MTVNELLRSDLKRLGALVPEGSRVLDLGCGDGALMGYLRDERGCVVRGLEIDSGRVAGAVARGLSVIQADLDQGLTTFPDDSFDVAVLAQTLQVVRSPALVLREMLRVADRAIVSFPNFGHWRVRAHLALRGRMPVSRAIPYTWYETPNIHHTTIADFRDFVAEEGGVIMREIPLITGAGGALRRVRVAPNLRADLAFAIVGRGLIAV
jgi:methionine biosynthesis protein MetW